MPEIHRKCMYGKCTTRASGVFSVERRLFMPTKRLLENGKVEWFARFIGTEISHELLCAAHGFNRKGVTLIKSLCTEFIPPEPKPEVQSMAVPVVVQRSKEMKPLRLQFITDNDYDPNPEWLR